MDIEIVGRHTLFFDDDTTAAFVNSEDALVEWNSLLIDRYDVRHLLSSPPPSRRRRNSQTSHSSSADAEIDYERYLDLPPPSEEEEPDAKPEPVGGFNAVPFSYGNQEESNDQNSAEAGAGAEAESEVPRFQPPFPVPESLVHHLVSSKASPFHTLICYCLSLTANLDRYTWSRDRPPTEKTHQIISRTALFVSKNGGQSEIVLRVKQGDNPTFGFLMPDHNLHPYFRFLVNHKDLLKSNHDKTSDSGALSLLGSTYGTGEDNEDDDHDHGHDDNVTTKHASSSSSSGKDKLASCTTALTPGQQSLPVKKEASITKPARSSSLKNDELSSSVPVSTIRASSLPPIPKTEHMVLDPPPGMKQLVDKIVEFIIKNGRQFEGVLIEQDRGHGRFPFLIPSNIFHPYYLKVLKKTQESNLPVKSFHNDTKHHTSKKTSNSSMESDDIDSDRKEKFKMVINKPKKESSDTESNPVQEKEVSVQVDAAQAAAILQAATRGGVKPPNLDMLNGKFGVFESNEQKLKAERLKRAKMFVAMLKSGSHPAPSKSEPQEKKVKLEKEHLEDEKREKRKHRDKSSAHDYNDDEKRIKKKYRDRSSVHDDDDDDDEREEKKSRKKKHESYESEERYKKKHHHRSRDDDVDKKEEREKKRKKKHRSSSLDEEEEEEEEEEEGSRRKEKHRSHKSSSSSSHRHKHKKSHSSRHKHKREDGKCSHSEEEGVSLKISGRGVSREPSMDVSSSSHQDQRPQSRPVETSEVPDELRAKIRAMLMSTM
ncbi:hypothetical protein LXL04_037362 [Taraxacum kok-saghyz]